MKKRYPVLASAALFVAGFMMLVNQPTQSVAPLPTPPDPCVTCWLAQHPGTPTIPEPPKVTPPVMREKHPTPKRKIAKPRAKRSVCVWENNYCKILR